MKPAIITRAIQGKNFSLKKGEKVYLAQKNLNGTLVRIDKDSNIEYPVPSDAVKLLTDKVEVKIHVKRLPRRNEAMFYFGKHIATVTKGHKTIFVESAGEMKAYFKEKGDCYQNERLAKELRTRKTTDKGLKTLGSNDMIGLNNWFRLYIEENGVFEKEEIVHTYDEAVELAKNII